MGEEWNLSDPPNCVTKPVTYTVANCVAEWFGGISIVLNNHRQHISLVVEKLTCKSLAQGYPSFSLALTGDLLLCVPG